MQASIKDLWEPFREAHAIEVAALAVVFGSDLNDVVLTRALRQAEKVAVANGLNQRDSLSVLKLTIGPTPFLDQQSPIQGASFKRLDYDTDELGARVTVPVEELIIDRNNLIYRSRQYERWSGFQATALKLFSPVLEPLLVGAPLLAVRLEYRDRFNFDGDPKNASPDRLLKRNSTLIAPHVFQQKDLWHLHTGMFVKTADLKQRLIQVTLDANDLRHPTTTVRSVSIMTGVQDNFDGTGNTLDGDQNFEMVAVRLEGLHDAAIATFQDIVSEPIGRKIGLTYPGRIL